MEVVSKSALLAEAAMQTKNDTEFTALVLSANHIVGNRHRFFLVGM